MKFVCRDCGTTTQDIDTILDGACGCGSTRFQLVSETTPQMLTAVSTREIIRKDLHRWVDLNMDAMEEEDLSSLRVSFECGDKKVTH